ncbi:NAD-dependent epimerase/dehydratase family protein [Rhizosphaericola mali]|uniref:NAD-dependent epimerase/dehydratase family protein n=1 Tax=Rhizosphaericola mali TaxID=2545455 RepID=A0A5P2G5K7_9BACT|nr:NAD-dependent epimerase/dehydratase family protein [Rhizosphaericola mali]QES89040.1 NAD-dependent epimerase/dehydratase family protein [Rhizosphaericola mali]
MVIGNGLVAKAFEIYKNNNDFVVFASGVSNSSERNPEPFEREKKLLLEIIHNYPDKHLIYFSTCSIYDEEMKTTPYVLHKLALEKLIQDHSSKWNIFRISNLIGKTENQNTILNYLYLRIKNYQHFTVWKGAERNIIDIVDAFAIIQTILVDSKKENRILDIANLHNYKIEIIVDAIEVLVNKNGNYNYVDKPSQPNIPMLNMENYIPFLNTIFTNNYLQNVLKKYYRS